MEAYGRYGPALLRKCERMLCSTPDAEDVVQGLFCDLLRKGLREPDLPYLYRAATNRCLNLLRDRKRRGALLQQQDEHLRGPARTLCEEQVIGTELLARLAEQLDEATAEVLVYRFLDDLTQEEIAELTATSRKTVGKRIERIRRTMEALAAGAPSRSGVEGKGAKR